MPLRLAVVGLSALLAASPQPSQDHTPVTSATVRVERKPVDLQFVYLENLREVPLVEWKIAVFRNAGDPHPTLHSYQRYDRAGAPYTAGSGRIASGETRRIRLSRLGDPYTRVEVTLAIFADGWHEGSGSDVGEFRKRQEALAEDLAYWQLALAGLPRTPQEEAFAYLRTKADDRQRVNPDDPSGIRQTIMGWISVPRPPFWTFRPVDNLKTEIKERLAEATAYRARSTSTPSEADVRSLLQRSLSVRTEPGQGTDFVAYIENLRDTPLEAWSIDFYDTSRGIRLNSRRDTDACVALDDTQSEGRLKLHETREMHLSDADNQTDRSMPHAVLRLALWQDLSFEGSTSRRDERFQSREREAARYAFWIAALKDASGKPAGEAVAFLRTKREERRREAPQEGDFLQGNDESWAARAAREPNAPAGWLDDYRRTLEQQYGLLTRHLTRLIVPAAHKQ